MSSTENIKIGFWDGFKNNAAAVGVYFTLLVASCGSAVYAQRTVDQTKSDLALAEEKLKTSEKNLILYKELFETKIEKEVAVAERRIADKFLMLGFAEEYVKYQSLVLPGKCKVLMLN